MVLALVILGGVIIAVAILGVGAFLILRGLKP